MNDYPNAVPSPEFPPGLVTANLEKAHAMITELQGQIERLRDRLRIVLPEEQKGPTAGLVDPDIDPSLSPLARTSIELLRQISRASDRIALVTTSIDV